MYGHFNSKMENNLDKIIQFILSDYSVWTLALALIIALVQTWRNATWSRWSEASLIWIAFWVLGVGGVYGFIAHIAFGSFIAEQIGWPNSPFQNEVAYANLTIGILGFTSFWYRKREYLLAAMVAYMSWFFADGIGHIVSLVTADNMAPSNSGSILYTDLLTPILVFILLLISRNERTRLK